MMHNLKATVNDVNMYQNQSSWRVHNVICWFPFLLICFSNFTMCKVDVFIIIEFHLISVSIQTARLFFL